ncbi:MAG: hypothetical protein IPI45_14285 [Saprospiraceae bacterium]|nr:hypothetical protein [Saprospiraceae bacterium]
MHVAPANTVCVDLNKELQHHSWWDYNYTEPNETISPTDVVEENQRLLDLAVKKQMVADVPVGSYLSGGMDSGSLSVLAVKSRDRLYIYCRF